MKNSLKIDAKTKMGISLQFQAILDGFLLDFWCILGAGRCTYGEVSEVESQKAAQVSIMRGTWGAGWCTDGEVGSQKAF